MFWALILEPFKRYSQHVKNPFHVSMASLDLTMSNDTPVQVMVNYNNKNFLLCTLHKSGTWQVPLDLNFERETNITFICNGRGYVHLTGYMIPNDNWSDVESSDESEDKLSLMDVISEKPNKRKATELKESKNIKKTKRGNQDSIKNNFNGTDEEYNLKSNKKNLKKHKKDLDSDEECNENDEENKDDEVEDESQNDDESEDAIDEDEAEDMDEDEDEDEMEDDYDDDDENEDEDEFEEDEDEEEDIPQEQQQKPEQKKLVKSQQSVKNQKQNQQQDQHMKKQNEQKLTNEKQVKQDQSKQSKKEKMEEHQKKDQNETKKRTVDGGVQIEEIKFGNGAPAKHGKLVSVYYVGRCKIGREERKVDSCTQGNGFKFRLGKGEVIKGWDVGITGMKVGGKRRLTIPPNMGYGAKGSPPVIPSNSTLVFDIELKNIN